MSEAEVKVDEGVSKHDDVGDEKADASDSTNDDVRDGFQLKDSTNANIRLVVSVCTVVRKIARPLLFVNPLKEHKYS